MRSGWTLWEPHVLCNRFKLMHMVLCFYLLEYKAVRRGRGEWDLPVRGVILGEVRAGRGHHGRPRPAGSLHSSMKRRHHHLARKRRSFLGDRDQLPPS